MTTTRNYYYSMVNRTHDVLSTLYLYYRGTQLLHVILMYFPEDQKLHILKYIYMCGLILKY